MSVGVWLIGARGSVATTVITGIAALSRHLAGPTTGLVSELDDFTDVDLVGFDELIVGGHDISSVSLRKRAEQLGDEGVFPHALAMAAGDDLDATESRIRSSFDDTTPPRDAIALVQHDIAEFKESTGVSSVIAVNVASTERVFPSCDAHTSLDLLDAALDSGEPILPPSSLYAYAALDAGHAYIDFTPSLGSSIAALDELARARNTVHTGRDGKTGETLMKTALAPMFLARNLKVRSWSGMNVLGGGDGEALADPHRKASKLESKARSIEQSLGYDVTNPVHIDYVEDMGEWKTAWNQVRFDGFLGTTMTLQFTWEGCDSALAAPIVIDLVRFVEAAKRAGQSGAISELAFFFKDPIGTDEHRLGHQFHVLSHWAKNLT